MGLRRTRDREEAIRLRLAGFSYNGIRKKLNVRSKGTISSWLSGLVLTPEAKRKLAKNIEKATRLGLLQFNIDRTERIRDENTEMFKIGHNNIGKLSGRELLLVGAALYWGEGTKFARPSSPALVFTNSDPRMIKVYLRFARLVLKTPEERIRAGINLYPSTDVSRARKYWSRITRLPIDRFYISTLISGASSGIRRPDALPYGTLVLRINDRKKFHYVMGMLAGLARNG